MTMNYFDFEGARVVYEDTGQGYPVILVHGTLWHQPWGKFRPLLASKYRVISLHLPGYGDSEVVPGKVHDTDLLARSLCRLVQHLQLREFSVIGLSLGTVVSLKAASLGVINGKLILAGMPTQTVGVMVTLSHWLPKIVLRQIAKIAFVREKILMASIRINVGRHKKELHMAKSFSSDINKTSPEAIADVDYVRMVKELPHLISEVANEKIFIYGQYDLQKKGANAWGIKYNIVKKAGHNVFADQPEEVFTLVTKLLPDTP